MAIRLTLSQIIELSGGRPRKMKLFADQGVLIPIDEDRASRAPRMFPMSEAAIGCIVAALDRWEIKIGTLRSVADLLRDVYRVPDEHGFRTHAEANRHINRDLLIHVANPKSPPDAEAKRKLANKYGFDKYPQGEARFTVDESWRIRHWIALEEAREGEARHLALSVDPDGDWKVWFDKPSKHDEPPAHIVLRLDHILAKLR